MKAVILAGGKGTRLRPLTCDLPKPLVPLCGKPVLEYLFDLLIRNGFHDVCITLGYLGEQIREKYASGRYKALHLTFAEEDSPLGTAGAVRHAAKGWNEPFLVVSGDAMCDFELDKIMLFHNAQHADITVVGCTVDDPREYGLIEKDDAGAIHRFIEKPSWGQATTDLANTGIYVVNPSCLEWIPENRAYDFAKDLFPQMMQEQKKLYCYHAEGYWCDIGDMEAYMQCQKALLEGKIKFPLKKAAEGVFVQDALPAGEYSIVPPVYIASQVSIADGAQIGPCTVLGEESVVGSGARIRNSVLLHHASAGANTVMEQAILCSGAGLREKACLYEQSVVGAGSTVGARATVCPGVRIWPQKTIHSGSTVRENVQYGTAAYSFFEEGGISENVELTPQMCASLGAAIGSIPAFKKAGVGCDGTGYAKAMLLALEAGILSAGGHVWNFGDCFESQLSYCTAFCGLSVGVFLQGGARPQIRICGEGGLALRRAPERELETRMRKGEYSRCAAESVREAADMRSIRLMYARELAKQAPFGLRGTEASVQCANDKISLLMEDTLLKLGCLRTQSLLFRISPDGTSVDAVADGQTIDHDKLLAICCVHAFRSGSDVALPYDAPMALDTLASQYSRKVYRYLSVPADESDELARQLSAKQIFLRDGLYMTVRILSILRERGRTLPQLCAEIPTFYITRKTFAVSFSPAKLHELFGQGEQTDEPVREGVTLHKDGGRLLVTPTQDGRALRVLAESRSMEAAAEMCSGFERVLAELESKGTTE